MASEADIQRDLTAAMKARDTGRTMVLRGLVAAIKNLKVDKQVRELPAAEIATLVRKEINKRTEAVEFALKGGRNELVEQNRAEQAILESYLPAQLDAARLETVIRELARELGSTAIGPIMAKLKERYPGQYDGKLASELARKLS
ncbi:MAG TPA: GatB/YqeY domain-containing protein [Candidatus Kryptonia bacterium]|nr:GatB/YqeY domain-containing protein [Candidatus Kryptonia bacterium]